MTSEIRVNKIENRSGLGTVTFADTGVDLAGIVTATTFSGSGASLTALPSAQLSGALPAISAASLTNVPAANVVGVHTSLTVTNATTTGSAVVGGGVTISESGIEASGIGITCANINGGSIGGRRNLIINGAMNVAQRGTSSTSSGFYTVDRFQVNFTGTNEAPTQAQVALTSSDTPYGSGFRYAYKVTNGNQTGGGGAAKFIRFKTTLEAQDIASSGWDYVSSSSFVTLSFWVKASVAQTYYGRLQTEDGTARNYPFSFALSANTWTKIIKTIPGNTSPTLAFDNNNGTGLIIEPIIAWYGTDYTGSMSLNTWATYSDRTPDFGAAMDDWYTTNDATLEITGVQLEVGSVATPFEHRSFGEEEDRCMRYYEEGSFSFRASGNIVRYCQAFNTRKRANPTMKVYYDSSKATDGTINSGNSNNSGWSRSPTGKNGFNIEKNTGSNGNGVDFAGYYTADAEL